MTSSFLGKQHFGARRRRFEWCDLPELRGRRPALVRPFPAGKNAGQMPLDHFRPFAPGGKEAGRVGKAHAPVHVPQRLPVAVVQFPGVHKPCPTDNCEKPWTLSHPLHRSCWRFLVVAPCPKPNGGRRPFPEKEESWTAFSAIQRFEFSPSRATSWTKRNFSSAGADRING